MRLRVVLVEPEGKVNVGFVARTCVNFGVDELYLVSPKAEIDEEALRYAAKARGFLEGASIVDSLDEALEGVDVSVCTTSRHGQRHDVLRHTITAEELARRMHRWSSMAIVFGRESTGLTRSELAKCHLAVTIPASPEYPVLNLSHAVAVVLYELWKARSGATTAFYEAADAETIGLVEKYVSRLVQLLGIPEPKRTLVPLSVRRILYQAAPSKAEALNFLYLVRKCISGVEGCREE